MYACYHIHVAPFGFSGTTLRQLRAALWIRGIESGPSEKQQVLNNILFNHILY